MSLLCLYLFVACVVEGILGNVPVMEPDDVPEGGSGEAAPFGSGLPELGTGAPSWVGGPVKSPFGPSEEALGSGDEAGSGSTQ